MQYLEESLARGWTVGDPSQTRTGHEGGLMFGCARLCATEYHVFSLSGDIESTVASRLKQVGVVRSCCAEVGSSLECGNQVWSTERDTFFLMLIFEQSEQN